MNWVLGEGGYLKTDEAIRIVIIGIVFSLLPLVATSSPQLRMITLIVAFALFTVALNIVFGHTDQLFLVVGGFAALGGYSTAIFSETLGVTPWLTLPLGVGIVGAMGGIVSYIAARRNLTIILIAIFTFALQLALSEFFVGARSITGGTVGKSVEGIGIDSDLGFYYIFLGMLVVFLVVYAVITNSKYGFSFMAVRQDQVAAASVGVDIIKTKVFAGTVGSLMFGLVGAVWTLWSGYISPGTFSFIGIDVLVLIMLTIGGMRTLTGPVVGAVIVIAIEEYLAPYPQWRLVIFGSLLVVLYLTFREGIVPKAGELVEILRDRREQMRQ